MKRLARLFIAASLATIAQSSNAQNDDPKANQFKYEQAMYDYFGRSPFYAVPIFLSGARESGDTLTIGTYDRYSSREYCFPKLGKPTLQKTDLTKQQDIDGQVIAGAGQVSAKKIVSAAASASYDRVKRYVVSFTDVQVDETALFILENSADYSKCIFLRDLISNKTTDGQLVLTHFVVHGTREFTISLDKAAGGKGNVNVFSDIISSIFGGAQVDASYDGASHSLISIKGKAFAPVAFRPAFVGIDDFLLREQQIKKGIDKTLDEIWKTRDLKVIKEKVGSIPGLLIPPSQILSNMLVGKGKLTDFNPEKSQADRSYMNLVTLNLLVASEVYGTIAPR